MNTKNILPKRPIVLSIAGFDPCGGAGLFADIKTFEQLKTYGIGVQTALTVQNDIAFSECEWIEKEQILNQLIILLNRYEVKAVKIGIVQNYSILLAILEQIRNKFPHIPIVWDPVLKSSTGFQFLESDEDLLKKCLKNVSVITPNWKEMQKIFGFDFETKISEITNYCTVYLKGGHREDQKGEDIIYPHNGKSFLIKPRNQNCSEKHGSGCVLSSALTANLALGFPLQKAAFRAKKYTERFLQSNNSLLGYHKS